MPKPRLLLFVHGLGGNAKATWGRFGELVAGDPEFDAAYDVAYYSFPTNIFYLPWFMEAPSAQRLAEGLGTRLEYAYPSYTDVVLAAHSLGGLIVKRYLVDTVQAGQNVRVSRAVFFGVPNSGASLATVGSVLQWRHRQLAQLCRNSDFIEALNKEWYARDLPARVSCKYVLGGLDRVVAADSARGEYRNFDVATIAEKDHFALVKPRDADDLSFLVLRGVALAKPADVPLAKAVVPTPQPPRQIVLPPPPAPPRFPADDGVQSLRRMIVGTICLINLLVFTLLAIMVVVRDAPASAISWGAVPLVGIVVVGWRLFPRTV